MAIEQEKLGKAFAAIWIFLSIPISQNLYDDALEGGFFMRIFALLAVAAPIWLVFGWRWLTDKSPMTLKFWGALTIIGVATSIFWANDHSLDLEGVAYVPFIMSCAFIGIVWIYERDKMLKALPISKFFVGATSPEIKNTLDALNSIYASFNKEVDIQTSSAMSGIFDTVRRTIKRDKERTIYSISENKWKPRNLALLLISKAASGALASGQYHIYRGVLSAEGQGYFVVFNKAIQELTKSGFITPEEAEEDVKSVQEDIKSVG